MNRREPTDDESTQPTLAQAIDRPARHRLGVLSTEDLEALGVTRPRRLGALRRGELFALHRSVYRPTGVQLSDEAELRAACVAIGPHAVASHRCALWLWGLIEHPGLVEVTVPVAYRSQIQNLVVHRSTDLAECYRISRRGVPTTKPARALLDGAAVMPSRQLGEAVEQALLDKLVTVAGLRHILDELGRRGRRGAGPLRAYLDHRALADRRPESQLEPLMARLCRDHGVGAVEFQRTVTLDGVNYRPDFVIAAARLVIEVDGLDAHRTRDRLDSDLTRQNAFVRHGWLVLRYTSSHLRRPAKVAREIIAVAEQRCAELDGAVR